MLRYVVQLSEKNKFKASNYLGEINERETELRAARDKLLEMEEGERQTSVNQEKIKHERDYLMKELRDQQQAFNDLQVKFSDQARLLQSVCSHSKNAAISGLNYLNNEMSLDGGHLSNEARASQEAQRADRIQRQINSSSFMPLGDNPPKLYSEQDPTLQSRQHLMQGPGQGGVLLQQFHEKD